MIIKKILCKVNENQVESFSKSQSQWKSICDIDGFLGQIGGGDKKEPLTACIFSFWESQTAYQRFMNGVHDQVLLNSGQEDTYDSIDVDLLQEEFRIPGLEPGIPAILRRANFIRTAFSHVKVSRNNYFVEMQKEVWNPGMKKAKGMFMVFENPRLCRGFRRASSVGSKKASLHGKIRLVSRPPNLAI